MGRIHVKRGRQKIKRKMREKSYNKRNFGMVSKNMEYTIQYATGHNSRVHLLGFKSRLHHLLDVTSLNLSFPIFKIGIIITSISSS